MSVPNDALLGLVLRSQSPVTVWSGARQPGAEFALLSRSGSACRTTDCEYLFWGGWLFHGEMIPQNQDTRMVTFDQFWFSTCEEKARGLDPSEFSMLGLIHRRWKFQVLSDFATENLARGSPLRGRKLRKSDHVCLELFSKKFKKQMANERDDRGNLKIGSRKKRLRLPQLVPAMAPAFFCSKVKVNRPVSCTMYAWANT